MNPINEWEDAFGRQVSLGTTNEADLAAHYPYSTERFRVFVNGTRQFIEYGPIPEYEELVDGHLLKPQTAGDVVTMETTERYRYVVQFVLEWSAALGTNQELQSGEVVTLALGDADLANSTDDSPGPAADGWMWIWRGVDEGTEVTLAEYRAGELRDAVTVTLEKALSIWKRVAGETNWYNVGNTKFSETYTNNGQQYNPAVGFTSVDDRKGPETANKAIQLSVKAEAGAGTLTAELGSVGARTLGRVDGITREKTGEFEAFIGTVDTWVPVYAIQVDPARSIINTQLVATSIVAYDQSDSVRVMPRAFGMSKLQNGSGGAITDADFSSPPEQNETNSVVHASTAVAEFPDATGTIGPSASAPGGYQLGWASWHTSGSGSKADTSSGASTKKAEISSRDVCVFLAKAGTAGNITVEYVTEQDW